MSIYIKNMSSIGIGIGIGIGIFTLSHRCFGQWKWHLDCSKSTFLSLLIQLIPPIFLSFISFLLMWIVFSCSPLTLFLYPNGLYLLIIYIRFLIRRTRCFPAPATNSWFSEHQLSFQQLDSTRTPVTGVSTVTHTLRAQSHKTVPYLRCCLGVLGTSYTSTNWTIIWEFPHLFLRLSSFLEWFTELRNALLMFTLLYFAYIYIYYKGM